MLLNIVAIYHFNKNQFYMFSLFQGKFIRINFDASGYIAGANIGKKNFTFIFTSRETPMSHVLLNLCPWVGLCVQTTDGLTSRSVPHSLQLRSGDGVQNFNSNTGNDPSLLESRLSLETWK